MDHRVNRGCAVVGAAAAWLLLTALVAAPVVAHSGSAMEDTGTSATVARPAPARNPQLRVRNADDSAADPESRPLKAHDPALDEPGSRPVAAHHRAVDDPETRPVKSYRRPQQAAPAEDSGALAITVLGKTGVVVALMLACAAVWKRLRGAVPGIGLQPSPAMQVTSTVPLGPQRFLHLVTVGRQQLLVGSSPQSVSLIAVLEGGARPDPAREQDGATPARHPQGQASEEGWAGTPDAPGDRFEALLYRLRELESGPYAGEPADSRSAGEPGRREAAGRNDSRGANGPRLEPTGARGPRYARDSAPRSGRAFEDAWSGRAGGEAASLAPGGETERPQSPGSLFRTLRAADGSTDA